MPSKQELDKFLSDLEQEKLEQFVSDEPMKQAVKKVLLFGLYGSGTLQKGKDVPMPYENFALVFVSNFPGAKAEDVGNNLKACWEGMNLLANAFNDLELYKPIPAPKFEKNPGR